MTVRSTLPVVILFGCLAGGTHALEPTATPTPLPQDATAEVILEATEARWKTIKDYSCLLITRVTKGPKTERSILRYSFKPRRLWRSKVVEGSDVGSNVVRGPDGRIRANAGDGLIGAISITMAPDDKRLADPRGGSLNDADWGTQLAEFRMRAEGGWTFERRADETLPDGTVCYAVWASGPPDKNGETREVLYIEKERMILRASRIYEGEDLVDDTLYKDPKLDQGLEDDFFKL